jgi:DUF4097 and DUF4098 domain-containing protein YvlB
MRKSRLFFSSLIGLCVVSMPALAGVEGSFQRNLTVTGTPTLEIYTRSGDVEVKAGGTGSIAITGKIWVNDHWWSSGSHRAEVEDVQKNPPIQQNRNNIRIDYPNSREISISFEITVPADSTVRTHTGSGDQRLEGLKAAADLESGSGDLRLRDLSGGVRLHTGSGDVDAQDLAGAFTAETGSGDLRLDQRGSGDVQVHTGSGNIDLHGVRGALHAEAGSGDMTIDGTQTGPWEFRTGSGNVEVRLPSDASFDLDATTSSGSLSVDHPVTMTVQGDVERSRRSVKGKVREGGQTLTVRTGSGDISIY